VAQRKRLTQIDTLLSRLTEEGRQEFSDFVQCDRKLSDIQRWWAERGFSISITVVHTWRSRHYQAGARAKELAAFVKESRGISPLQLLEFCACEAAFAVSEVRSQLNENGYNPKDLIILLAAIKELRGSAEAFNNAKIRGDRTQDILSGAYEVCRKALTASKDHPNEQWLEELLNGELKATEDELKREQLGD
jgi:hypothetical protein